MGKGFRHDPTKLVVSLDSIHMTGFEVARTLREKCRTEVELSLIHISIHILVFREVFQKALQTRLPLQPALAPVHLQCKIDVYKRQLLYLSKSTLESSFINPLILILTFSSSNTFFTSCLLYTSYTNYTFSPSYSFNLFIRQISFYVNNTSAI